MSFEEDMTLTPISGVDISATATPMETVELSFSTGAGGAWDDRELIKASNAAMKEFHIHHPGPGSWLDKATAALAQGRPLPGADAYGTEWYTASLPTTIENTPEVATATAPPAKRPRKDTGSNTRQTRSAYDFADTNGVQNPYAPSPSTSTLPQIANGGSTQAGSRNKRRQSPTYAPASPGLSAHNLEEEEEEEFDEDAEWEIGEFAQPPAAAAAPASTEQETQTGFAIGPVAPSLGIQAAGVSRDDALSYAMTAQYWAGYWMGVAQAHGGAAGTPDAAGVLAVNGEGRNVQGPAPNGRTTMNGLRR